MIISEKKKLERSYFRNLRDKSSSRDRKNVEINVKLYLESFSKKNQKLNYIAVYWPLKNEVDITSLKEKYSLALPRCEENKKLSFYKWDTRELTEDSEGILAPYNSNLLGYEDISVILLLYKESVSNFTSY